MSLDNPLFIGVLLIVVGLAFALFAYAIFLNRGGAEQSDADEPIEEANEVDDEAQVNELVEEPEALEAEELESPPSVIPEDQLEGLSEDDSYLEEIAAGEARTESEKIGDERDPEPQVAPMAEATVLEEPSTAQVPVAMLFRDEVTGSLIVRVGEQEYRRPSEIQDPTDKRNIEFAAIDLAGWFAEELQSRVETPAPESIPDSQEFGMVAQINSILERNLAEADPNLQAVRLLDDSFGGVRVLIGLETYDLEQVPDEEIKRMIREAVAEWEASQ